MRSMALFLPILAQLLVSSAAAAQIRSAPVPGDVVRMQSAAGPYTYEVLEWSPVSVRLRDLRTGAQLSVPPEDATGAELRIGMEPRGRSALRGFGIGLLTGAVIGGIIGFADGDDPAGWFSFTAEEKALLFGGALGVAGGTLGGVIGLASPRSRWAPLAPSVAVSGSGLGVRLTRPL